MKMKMPIPYLTVLTLSVMIRIASAEVFSDGEIGLGKALTKSQLSQLLLHGDHRVTKGYLPNKIHAGIDFGDTDDGVTSVYTPVSGTIIKNTAGCGRVAVFDGTNTIILAHMVSRTTLKENSQIIAGTYVGKASRTIGDGCTADGPHLHIEIRTGRNTYMADPATDSSRTTLDPLTYNYDQTPPTISITSPPRNYSFSTGRSYAVTWTASDPSGLGDVSVELISSSAVTCIGARSSAIIRLAGAGYVGSIQWPVPTSLSRGSYNLKVAVRDNLNNWGCTMIPVSVR